MDRERLRGWRYDYIGIDNLESFTQDDLFFLMGRQRPTSLGDFPQRTAVTFSQQQDVGTEADEPVLLKYAGMWPNHFTWPFAFFSPWLREQDEPDARAEYGEVRDFVHDPDGAVWWLKQGEHASFSTSATVISPLPQKGSLAALESAMRRIPRSRLMQKPPSRWVNGKWSS